MEIIDINPPADATDMQAVVQTIFEKNTTKAVKFSFGTAVIPVGARVPVEGSGSHEGDEYSIILKGEIRTSSGGMEARVKEGQASFIPAGESHWALNESDRDCELVWVMIEENGDPSAEGGE